MPIDTAYLRERYASLRDDELQRLRGDEYAQLSPDAQEALREEMERREALHPKPAWLGQPCPLHPGAQVEAACARCGRFLCRQCVADPHQGSICPECQRRIDSEPWRFNLWLGLAFVGLFEPPLSFLSDGILFARVFLWPNPHLPFAESIQFGWKLASNLGLACLSALIIPKYWKKLRAVPRWMLGFYLSSLGVGVIDLVLSQLTPGAFWRLATAAGLVVTGLWIRYFSVSENVRRTFIN